VTLPAMVQTGDAPIDRYVVLEHLSEGGMGAIYVGKKLGAGGFEMEVVLKQLLPEFTQQEEFIDLFLREAKLSATLDHANIVHTIDLVTAGGEYFIVMEYLPGGDLRTLLKKVKGKIGYMSPEQAKSESLDHRSDLYSLAVCMYEVLTGERLFVHAGLTTSADEIYSQPVPLVSRKVPGLTPDLDAIMLKALAL